MGDGVSKNAIEKLADARERIASLEAALEPFARMSSSYDDARAAEVIASHRGTIISVYDLRLAKAAL